MEGLRYRLRLAIDRLQLSANDFAVENDHGVLGFVAILWILALLGMITKNAVILIGQIESERAQGKSVWDAAIDAS